MRVIGTALRATTIAALLLAVACVAQTFSVTSAVAAVVNRIDVTGNERVEDETVRAYMTVQPRRAYSDQDVDDSLRALYATGLFSDVAINKRGAVLVVSVTENALIYKVSFEGNDKYDDKMLLTQVKSKPRSVLSRAKVEADTQLLLELYRRKGRYRATVEPKIIKLAQNRVNLVFEINEGDKTGVARINFIGNHAFSDSRLRDVIKTRESGLLSFIRSTDSYDPSRLESDQEALREYYLRHGYADFRIISAVADLDRERNTFFVTFTVEEGEQYTIGEVNVQSSLASVGPEELASAVRTDPGDTYDSREVDKTLEDIVLEVSERGYAFAEVNPRGERDYENHTINITYHVDEGPRVYIERIDIRGNTRTRDYVIRRELDFAEGDAFNRVLINKAKRRLKNLGFFKDVAITTQRGSSADRVVIVVNVEEQATGELSFGAGYSSAEGVIGDVSITERNFLGRGQFVRAAVGGGESTRTYEFSFREPYFMGRRLSAGFDLYRRQYEETDYRSYEETTTGGNLTFGLPLNEEVQLNLTYSAYQRDFDVADELKDGCYMRKYNRGDPIPRSCDRNGDGKFDRNLDTDEASLAVKDAIGETFTSIIGYSLIYDTRDDIKRPRDGYYGKFQQEFAGVGGDVAFIRTTVEGRAYREIWADRGIVGMLKVKAGHIESLDDRLKLPDHFFLGGETIRGFGTKGIGPRDGMTRDALGGRYYIAGTAEATFPLPAVPSEIGLEGALFTDAGTLVDVDDSANFFRRVNVVGDNGDLRWAAGFGVIWHSPFGPIRADFAWPIVKSKWDETQVFRIGGGTQF